MRNAAAKMGTEIMVRGASSTTQKLKKPVKPHVWQSGMRNGIKARGKLNLLERASLPWQLSQKVTTMRKGFA